MICDVLSAVENCKTLKRLALSVGGAGLRTSMIVPTWRRLINVQDGISTEMHLRMDYERYFRTLGRVLPSLPELRSLDFTVRASYFRSHACFLLIAYCSLQCMDTRGEQHAAEMALECLKLNLQSLTMKVRGCLLVRGCNADGQCSHSSSCVALDAF